MEDIPTSNKFELELTNENVEELLARIEANAQNRERVAAESDSQTDGGAGLLRAEIKAFQAGREGTIPESWRSAAEQLAKEKDPAYPEYEKLKDRFQ